MASFPLPSSSNLLLLDRVKNFLPIIAKANKELEEKMKKNEQIPQIDTDLVETDPTDASTTEDKENVDDYTAKGPIIQLDFAVGDFDGSTIARLEEEIGENDGEETETKS